MMMMGDKKRYVSQILGPEEKDEAPQEEQCHTLCRELYSCITNNDVQGGLECLRSLFMYFDSEPHHEGPHEE